MKCLESSGKLDFLLRGKFELSFGLRDESSSCLRDLLATFEMFFSLEMLQVFLIEFLELKDLSFFQIYGCILLKWS